MKQNFQTKLRIIVIIIYVILIAQSAFIIHSIKKINLKEELIYEDISIDADSQKTESTLKGADRVQIQGSIKGLDKLKDRIVGTEYIFLFIEIILGVILFFYVPVILYNSLQPIEKVFKEIERGTFDIIIPEKYKKGPISKLIHSVNIMINNIKKFDKEKKDKIVENFYRLNLTFDNIDDGAIITNEKDEIVLINKHAQTLLGITSVDDNPLLLDFHYEGEVLKYFQEAVAKKMVIPEKKIYFPKIKKHITFRHAITHNEQGNFTGMVIILAYIDLKKLYEKEPSDDDESKQKNKN